MSSSAPIAVISIFICCGIRTASAEGTPQYPPSAILDLVGTGSSVGEQLSYISDGSGVDAARSTLTAQYQNRTLGIGGYLQLPINYYTAPASSSFGLGDAELGALGSHTFGALDVVAHAGIALPLASTDRNAEAAVTFATPARLTDLYLAIPGGTSIRLAVSPLVHTGHVFARADIGFDANVANSTSGENGTALRLNLAGGVQAGAVSLAGELTNSRVASGGRSLWLESAALTGAMRIGALEPYGALIVPVDDDAGALFRFAVTLGVRAQLDR